MNPSPQSLQSNLKPATPGQLALARAAKGRKKALLAQARALLIDGDETVHNLIAKCAADGGTSADPWRYLRDASLVELLAWSEGGKPASFEEARRAVRRMLCLAGEPAASPLLNPKGPAAVDAVTVAWLLDRRARGQRLLWWADVTGPDLAPTSGLYGGCQPDEIDEWRPPIPTPVTPAPLWSGGGRRTHFNDLPPSLTESQARIASRVDVYYSRAVASGFAQPYSVSDARRSGDSIRLVRPSRSRTRRRIFDRIRDEGDLLLCAIGALHAYRALVDQQLAFIIGCDPQDREFLHLMQVLFDSGLANMSHPASGRRRILTCSSDATYDRLLADALSRRQRYAVTGGLAWRNASSSIAHDVLSAEILLRCAELFGATIFGQTYCRLGSLDVDEDRRLRPPPWSRAYADGLIVPMTGTPIAIEVVRSARSARSKIPIWLDYLADVPREGGGVDVVFLVATPPAEFSEPRTPTELRNQIRSHLKKNLRDRGGCHVADRVGVASWSDWFPNKSTVDVEAFRHLVADALGPAARWTPRAFADLEASPRPAPHNQREVTRHQRATEQAGRLSSTPAILDARPALVADDELYSHTNWRDLPLAPGQHHRRRALDTIPASERSLVPGNLLWRTEQVLNRTQNKSGSWSYKP